MTEPTARELLARLRAADREARAAQADRRDADRRQQAARRDHDAALSALVARLTPPPVSAVLEAAARYFAGTPAAPPSPPPPVTGAVTVWAANRSKSSPRIHAARPGDALTLCQKRAGPAAGTAEPTCPACIGVATGTPVRWPKPGPP
jgi:type II secretory pathway pseudopilin PulG